MHTATLPIGFKVNLVYFVSHSRSILKGLALPGVLPSKLEMLPYLRKM